MLTASLALALLVGTMSAPSSSDSSSSAPASPDLPPDPPTDLQKFDPGRWGFAAIPRLTLSVDDGLGLGVRGSAFWYRFDTQPYKTAISFQAWATTNLVQHHFARVDAIDAFNQPLRLEAEVGLFQTLSANFCGLGDQSVCIDDGNASKVRFIAPYGNALARLRLFQSPRTQLVFGWRGTQYIPGTWGDFTPYPGSVYAAQKEVGESGFVSQMSGGLVVDTRDFEPSPTRGILAAVVLRGADPLLRSTWRYAGANAQALVFTPLARPLFGDRVVLAQRVMADVIVGDAPILELMKVGGLQESFAYGGQDLGRGLRLTRFVGGVKLMAQEELRIDFAHLDVFGNDLGLGGAVFLDVGAVSSDLDAFAARLPVPAWGAGVAFRYSWNRNFVVRIDVGMSPVEGLRVGLYTTPGQPF